MTISVFIAVTGCPSDKRAEAVTKSKAGVEAVVATLGPNSNTANIIYDGQEIIPREADKAAE